MPEDIEMESDGALCRLHVETSQSFVVQWRRLGDDVGESAEVWREVEIEDITMEGFVQESYFLGIIFWLSVLLGPCHLLFGVRRYPHECEVTRARNLNSQDRSTRHGALDFANYC
jgi:hypothetical protein